MRRVSSRLPRLPALMLIGTAACSYIFELPATSGAATADDGGLDAKSDVVITLGDATTPTTDAPPDAPAAARFCSGDHAAALYCADFDDTPAPTLDAIGKTDTSGDGSLLIADAVSLSPPRALRVSMQGLGAMARVTHALGASPASVTLAFDQNIAEWQVTTGELAGIETAEGPSKCDVRLEGTATTWRVTQVCYEGDVEAERLTTDTTSAIRIGQWQHFILKVTFSSPAAVSIDVDGAHTDIVGVSPLTQAPTSIVLGGKLDSTGSATLFQDNVLVTAP